MQMLLILFLFHNHYLSMYGYSAPPPVYAPPPPAYYPPPPAYYPPPPSAPAAGPMIINLGGNNGGNDSGSPCPACGKDTGNMPRKTIGGVAIAWAICLCLTLGVIGCYPLCNDSCKDTELICVKCQTVKTKIPANCC